MSKDEQVFPVRLTKENHKHLKAKAKKAKGYSNSINKQLNKLVEKDRNGK